MLDKDLLLHAEQLLENPVYKLIFDELEEEITKKWKDSPYDDEKGQKECKRLIYSIRAVKNLVEKKVAFIRARALQDGRLKSVRKNIA